MRSQTVLAYCGNDCLVCPRYRATASGDPGELARVAKIWVYARWRDADTDPADLACRGCGPTAPCRYGIAACAADKELEHCGQCGRFACPRLAQALAATEESARRCRDAFDEHTYRELEAAFFRKRERLLAAGH